MATINKPFFYKHLRNKTVYNSYYEAKNSLKEQAFKKDEDRDGIIILARYRDYPEDSVKTLMGIVCDIDGEKSLTMFESCTVFTENNEKNSYSDSI